MKKILILIAIVLLSLGLTRTALAQTSRESSSARAQAILHLGQLVNTYNVSLNESETELVKTICRDLQSSTIQALSTSIGPMRTKYISVASNVDSTIKFTANSLREMSEDSSALDLASVHLSSLKFEFENTVTPYKNALDELLVIDCQIFPELFVAGLEEARFRQKLVLSAAEDIVDFRDNELENAYNTAQHRLEDLEAAQI